MFKIGDEVIIFKDNVVYSSDARVVDIEKDPWGDSDGDAVEVRFDSDSTGYFYKKNGTHIFVANIKIQKK